MGAKVSLEIAYVVVFFAYGLICLLLYKLVCLIEKHSVDKLANYLLDIIFVLGIFVPFYQFYITVLDGKLSLYEVIAFIFGAYIYSKYISIALVNALKLCKKNCPIKIGQRKKLKNK